jgi:hypothetical protein
MRAINLVLTWFKGLVYYLEPEGETRRGHHINFQISRRDNRKWIWRPHFWGAALPIIEC